MGDVWAGMERRVLGVRQRVIGARGEDTGLETGGFSGGVEVWSGVGWHQATPKVAVLRSGLS
jgi:hypothetical protein